MFAVARRSAERLFHALGAAVLNARSPNLSRERVTSISLLVADRSADWDMRSDARCSVSLTSSGAVLTTAECTKVDTGLELLSATSAAPSMLMCRGPPHCYLLKPKFHLARHVTSQHYTTRSTCRARRDERV